MKRAGFGRVINVASILANFGLAERTPYCSSKGRSLQLTRVLALWSGPKTASRSTRSVPAFSPQSSTRPCSKTPKPSQRLCAKIPVGRFGEPHEIKAAALFLASPAANYVTGSAIYVDGGVTAEV